MSGDPGACTQCGGEIDPADKIASNGGLCTECVDAAVAVMVAAHAAYYGDDDAGGR